MKKPINLTLYCIGCRGVIPAERTKKRSNTCGDVCRNRVEKLACWVWLIWVIVR